MMMMTMMMCDMCNQVASLVSGLDKFSLKEEAIASTLQKRFTICFYAEMSSA